MISRLSFSAIVLLAVHSQAAVSAKNSAVLGLETLVDGNERDARPADEQIAKLLDTSKKNMIKLPGGTFEMGDWGSKVNAGALPFDGSPDSKPLHNVTLTGFSMGKYPVTYAEFDMFTADLGLPRINQASVLVRYRKPNNPAGVSWQGAKDYCQWLGKRTGLRFDLPTEAQWEYAARSGGKRHLYPTDDGTRDDGRNVPSFEQKNAGGGLLEVGSFPPNPSGFYDFGGVMREWTNDWYSADYYSRSTKKNPQGPEDGSERVVRGNFGNIQMTFQRWHRAPTERDGTWTKSSESADGKDKQIPYTKYSGTASSGFRCVMN